MGKPCQNHPFIDGNKRVAFAVVYTFLEKNGAWITADADATYAFINGLYESNSFDFAHLSAWLRDNVAVKTADADGGKTKT